jgi:GT2 family glycosyltransferase
MPTGPTPELTVIVSTLGNYETLARVLDGYERQDAPPGSFEMIVVVDKADPDPEAATAAIGERPYPTRRLTGRAPGLSANRNTGWREARAPVLLFTDNDTIPVPALVSEHLARHREHPEPEVAVAGHIRWAPELEVTPFMRWLDQGLQFNFGSIAGTEAGWGNLYGANSSIKRAMIERVGDWDEERLPYLYDDLDWSYRASKQGLRVLYARSAIVDHVRPDMTLEFWKSKMRRSAYTERQFIAKHPELEPWFFRMFSYAASLPKARGRAARLTRYVPRSVPWIGPRVWGAADLYWKQQLAPHFLEAWDEFEQADETADIGMLRQSAVGGSD